jgi:sucrose phosphorylase
MKNGVQLITYPDSLGINLEELSTALERYFPDLFTGIHLLPFYPSSADRGFAPLGYDRVDPQFGDWNAVEGLAGRYDIVVDFMVNHISRHSPQFLDFLKRGEKSPWADLFLNVRKFHPSGEIPPDDLAKIYTRKPRAPLTKVVHPDGSEDTLWCTFSEEQIDLDIASPVGTAFLEDNLRSLCGHGISMLRLDAFAYVTKRLGTNCFFVEPDVWELLHRIQTIVAEYGVEILPEIHEHYSIQLKLANKGYRVYDFALPMLLLHTIFSGSSRRLKEWLKISPHNQITTLDTHDGIGVVDAADLLSSEEIEKTVDALYERGSNVNRRYSSEEYNNLDIYQINCTYYSATGEDDDAYILSRAIQFFAPGIPQVYYVGALSGRNDTDLIEQTKQGRDINRHPYSLDEIAVEIERPVNKRLFRLMRFRSHTPAFEGSFSLADSDDSRLSIVWTGNGGDQAILDVDLNELRCEIRYRDALGKEERWIC